MKTRLLFWVVMISAFCVYSQKSSADKIMTAVMNAYEEALEKNPNDYHLLFDRANQYFLNGEYLKSLDDINKAMKFTSRDEAGLLFEEYMLRAKIYDIRGEYNFVVNDANEALRLQPNSLPALYLRAGANYETANYAESKADYEKILRVQPLDYNAMNGLARVAVKQQNFGLAKEYSDKAVDLYPAQAVVYVNRAEILAMTGEYNASAHDLIHAVSLDYEKSGALQALVEMSHSRYNVVMDALADAIEKAPQSGMLRYLRAMIGLDHYNFAFAAKELDEIIKSGVYTNDGIYYDLASAYYNLCDFKNAIQAVNNAIVTNPNIGAYYVLRSKIQHALSYDEDAMKTINSTLAVEPDDADALIQKAILLRSAGKFSEAVSVLNEVVLTGVEKPYAYLLRADIRKKNLGDIDGAVNDYKLMLNLRDKGLGSLRGFALLGLGRNAEAKLWIEDVVEHSGANGELFYMAAACYSACGDTHKALDYLEGALANGYGSYYCLTLADEAGVDVTKLFDQARYKTLMEQYKNNFSLQ